MAYATWNPQANYLVGDTVSVAGIDYIALLASTGVSPPSDPLTWDVLVTQGPQGPPGPPGVGGPSVIINEGSSFLTDIPPPGGIFSQVITPAADGHICVVATTLIEAATIGSRNTTYELYIDGNLVSSIQITTANAANHYFPISISGAAPCVANTPIPVVITAFTDTPLLNQIAAGPMTGFVICSP